MASEDTYDWIFALSIPAVLAASFGIGANDVANAFATSVGSGALSIKQAVAIASVCEFGGAVFLGSQVTKTIRKGIADVDCFVDNPGLLMYGMFCVLIVVSIWLVLATKYEMPVSTTHSTVAGVVGMTLAIRTSSCVNWHEDSDVFPYAKGMSAIFISWLLSPIFSGVVAAVLFGSVRFFVLRSENALARSYWAFPVLIALTLVINIFFIIFKGAKGLDLDEIESDEAAAWAFGLGLGVTALITPPLFWFLKKRMREWEAENAEQQKDADKPTVEMSAPLEGLSCTDEEDLSDIKEDSKSDDEPVANHKWEAAPLPVDRNRSTSQVILSVDDMTSSPSAADGMPVKDAGTLLSYLKKNINTTPDDVIAQHKDVEEMYERAEKFDPRVEANFRYLQIFTAICDSFSHGANDVANAVGPFAAIYVTWRNASVSSKSELGDDAIWILAIGGVGIVAGLALYGYKIMHALGVKLTKMTPSRGFAIELGAALVILYGSREGWPLSTTHCQVGGTMGVGLLEGRSAVNWKVFGRTVLGWVLSIVVVGSAVALLVAQGAYAPNA